MRTIERKIVGAFIFSADDHVLLGYSGVYDGELVVPGGGMDEGETELEAVRREIQEETCIDITKGHVEKIIDDEGHFGSSEKTLRYTGERVFVKMEFIDFTVKMDQLANEIEIKADDDYTGALWVPLAELSAHKIAEPTKKGLASLGYL